MKHLHLIYIAVLALLLAACDQTIHIYPHPQQADVLLVPYHRLSPYTAYKELVYDENWHCQERRLDDHPLTDAPLPDDARLSLTLDILRGTILDDELREYTPDLAERITRSYPNLTRSYADTIAVSLPDGRYHIAAWSCYDDDLYDLQRLAAVDTRLQHFPALAHQQQAQAGREEFDIDFQLGPDGYPQVRGHEARDRIVPVELRRTQGRFRIEALDLDDYLQENPAAGPITVKAVFTLYVSCGFNTLTDLPNKFISTYTLDATPQTPAADLLTHYIFAPPTGETAILADFYLYRADGTLFNACQGLQIPIQRGGETVVRGHFLTHRLQKHGAIGVDESFQGEYIVPFEY